MILWNNGARISKRLHGARIFSKFCSLNSSKEKFRLCTRFCSRTYSQNWVLIVTQIKGERERERKFCEIKQKKRKMSFLSDEKKLEQKFGIFERQNTDRTNGRSAILYKTRFVSTLISQFVGYSGAYNEPFKMHEGLNDNSDSWKRRDPLPPPCKRNRWYDVRHWPPHEPRTLARSVTEITQQTRFRISETKWPINAKQEAGLASDTSSFLTISIINPLYFVVWIKESLRFYTPNFTRDRLYIIIKLEGGGGDIICKWGDNEFIGFRGWTRWKWMYFRYPFARNVL